MMQKRILILVATMLLVVAVAFGQSDTTKSAQMPTIVPEGVIYGFNGDTVVLHNGWIGVTDTIMNGKSTCDLEIIPGGANGSKQALQFSGTVTSENPYIMFAGGASRFGGDTTLAFDVTGLTGVRFWAKGDGNTYRIDLPTAAITDYMFYSFAFTPPTAEWKEYKIPFKGFKQQPYGAKVPWTGTDVIGVQFFTVGGPLESFKLLVDEIEFYK